MHIINFVLIVTNAEKATANLTIVSKNPELLRKSWWVVYFIKKKATQYRRSEEGIVYCFTKITQHAPLLKETGLQTTDYYRLPCGTTKYSIYHNNYEFKLNRE